jgi:hypothetical protein
MALVFLGKFHPRRKSGVKEKALARQIIANKG